MDDFNYEVGGFLFGYPIVAVNNPEVTIRLPLNLTISADLSEGLGSLGQLLSQGAGYQPPQSPPQNA